MESIPVASPKVNSDMIEYVTNAAAHAWYEHANMYHERFEKAFSQYVGTTSAMALPSCTSAIHLSLLSSGIGKGNEVIVPDLTWIATAAPITYVDATPVFADCDEKTGGPSCDVNLPCGMNMTKEKVEYVCINVNRVLGVE